MILHFAYGSNMSRAAMHKHAPGAEPVGAATLANYRFVITEDRYASVEPAPAQTVHGVLWRLTPRDRITLDVWEAVASGLYRAETLPVHRAGCRRPALVYVARWHRAGWPKPGYMELVIAAARAWNLPPDYIASLQRWLLARPLRNGARKFQEFGWTESANLSPVASPSAAVCRELAFAPGPK